MNSMLLPFRLGILLLASTAFTRADVRLHGLFTDQMVLQRNASVPVWGWADDGERVTVQFRDQTVTTIAAGGKWMVRLKKLAAGDPEDLKVSGKNSVTLHNVLVGEVWVASGQSNMEMAMRSVFDATNHIALSANPLIRFYTVTKLKADQPVENVTNTWQVSGPDVAGGFSAVAYYFAVDLQKALGVPVGIIHTSWGGSPCEVWVREGVLAANPGYKSDILDAYPASQRSLQGAIESWEKEKAEAQAAKTPFTKRRPGTGWKPSELYNGMIAPLLPFAIQGAIWYQGESNTGRAHQYRTLMADMISNWRKDWGQGNFTFLQVQLAPFRDYKPEPAESDWAELREAQNVVMQSLPKVGVAVITDVGEEKDIHPKKKQPAGARLALAAQHIAYGQDIVYSGPTYRGMKVKNDEAILSFNHVGAGLEARALPPRSGGTSTMVFNSTTGRLESPLAGFSICGEDHKFVWAEARIQGDKVIVSNESVSKPVAVRYGWADFPVVNLWNRDGIPASPFRTDDFPMITAPKSAQAKK